MRKLLLAILLSTTLFAQEGNKVSKPVPTFDEDDKLMLNALVELGNQANKSCNALQEFKSFSEFQKNLTARMQNKYKGYTLEGVNLVEIKK